MPRVPETVTKESYLLKSTFFYNRLRQGGYFELFFQIQTLSRVEGKKLNWDKRLEWNISDEAWDVLQINGIDPMLVFMHPKVLQMNPTFLKYYRSVAMLPQKGLKTISRVSIVEKIECGEVEAGSMSTSTIEKLVKTINEVLSLVVSLATEINEREIEGMMYATAGTNIDGSWRNSIGAEGERVIRSLMFKELHRQNEISSIQYRNTKIEDSTVYKEDDVLKNFESVKILNLKNGYSILFASEPDITMYDDAGSIVGVIEIKSGLDPAGALERLGAMLKSFENTIAEYPNAVTVLVASCITDEVQSRLGASMLVRQTYITTDITSSESNKRKFVNRMRKIMKLSK